MTRVRVYVGSLPGGLPAADADGFGLFRMFPDFGEMNPIRGVEYEPKIPRCATCRRYSPPYRAISTMSKYRSRYGWCRTTASEERTVPPDGSGYCHEHTNFADWRDLDAAPSDPETKDGEP